MKTGSTYKEPFGGQMGKIMGKLKHNYNALKELGTKFFHKQCVIWSFPPSFDEIHHKIARFTNFMYNYGKVTIRNKVTMRGISQ